MDYRKTVEHLRRTADTFIKSGYAVDGIAKCFEESADTIEQLVEELKQFKDKQEQGLLIELPCKVGDTVYFILREEIIPVLVDGFSINENGLFICGTSEEHFGYSRLTPPAKNLYLTHSEAEEALARMKGE